jgi:hypothetical protein
LQAKLKKIVGRLATNNGIVPLWHRRGFDKLGLVLPTTGLLTNPLHASAKAALDCFECLIAAGLAGQVGVKSS